MSVPGTLQGARWIIGQDDPEYPANFRELPDPPERLYGIGSIEALEPGLAIIGARRATPYGRTCARHFSRIASGKGISIISGGALGCDSEAHRGALDAKGKTVAFLGGGCDKLYPSRNRELFQQIVDEGGAVVSEREWGQDPLPYMFRERNRLIAGLACAVLIVEAGLPSGTFSTADEALEMGKEVLVVPGAITSPSSRGSNRLLFQGAIPVVDDESFEDSLFTLIGALRNVPSKKGDDTRSGPLIEAVLAQPTHQDELFGLAVDLYGEGARGELSTVLAEGEAEGIIERNAAGLWVAVAR